MRERHISRRRESGVATIEFALTFSFFFLMIVAVISGGHLFFTHNALVESTRRGARYAAMLAKPASGACVNNSTTVDPVKNMVLYGTPTAGTTPLVNNLTAANITVCYSNDFGVAQGTVSVKIENYNYTFAVAGRVI